MVCTGWHSTAGHDDALVAMICGKGSWLDEQVRVPKPTGTWAFCGVTAGVEGKVLR